MSKPPARDALVAEPTLHDIAQDVAYNIWGKIQNISEATNISAQLPSLLKQFARRLWQESIPKSREERTSLQIHSIIAQVSQLLVNLSQLKQKPPQPKKTLDWNKCDACKWLLKSIGKEFSLVPSSNMVELKRRIVPGLAATAKIRRKLEGKDGALKLRIYEAKFTFKTELIKYLKLQYPASSRSMTKLTEKLSSDIRFTSAGSDGDDGDDALALPVREYVQDTWGISGTLLLRYIQAALDDPQNKSVSKTLPHRTSIKIQIENDKLILDIEGIDDIIVEIVEQASWLACVGGEAQIKALERHMNSKTTVTTLEGYVNAKYIQPQVASVENERGYFNVTFRDDKKQSLATRGGSWKAMVGLVFVAKGYSIPRRPNRTSGRVSGLEASLSVLLELCKTEDGPTGMCKAGGASDRKFQVLFATGCEQGNLFYWHYSEVLDLKYLPSKDFYLGSKDDGLGQRKVKPKSLVKPRHFIGWSGDAKFLSGTSHLSYNIRSSRLQRVGRYQVVIPSVSITASFPAVASASISLAVVNKEPHDAQAKSEMRHLLLLQIKAHYFIFWDVVARRGWLIDGATAALHLLRTRLKKDNKTKDFDISSLNYIDERGPLSAFKVLDDSENQSRPLWSEPNVTSEGQEQEKNYRYSQPGKETQKAKADRTGAKMGTYLDGIYAALWTMIQARKTLDTYEGLSAAIRAIFEARWKSSDIKGWDYYKLAGDSGAEEHHMKIRGTGWLDLAMELKAVFVFGNGFGEILEPREGSCCCHFRTLPKGQNYLAVGIAALEGLIDEGKGPKDNNEEEVRIPRDICWVSPVKPFRNQTCGPQPHLDNLQHSCFPVQFIKRKPLKHPERENKPVEGRTLMRLGEYKDLLKKHPNGVVVFGKKQPNKAELKQLAQAAISSQPSDRASVLPGTRDGRGSVGSDRSMSGGNDTVRAAIRQSSAAARLSSSAHRTNSNSSMRSGGSERLRNTAEQSSPLAQRTISHSTTASASTLLTAKSTDADSSKEGKVVKTSSSSKKVLKPSSNENSRKDH